MSGYTPAVGDRVRLTPWDAGGYIDVLAIHDEVFWGLDQAGDCTNYVMVSPAWEWHKVTLRPDRKPTEDLWVAAWLDGTVGLRVETEPDRCFRESPAYAVRYTATDDIVWADEV